MLQGRLQFGKLIFIGITWFVCFFFKVPLPGNTTEYEATHFYILLVILYLVSPQQQQQQQQSFIYNLPIRPLPLFFPLTFSSPKNNGFSLLPHPSLEVEADLDTSLLLSRPGLFGANLTSSVSGIPGLRIKQRFD
jgi:hypothetical protein